MKKIIVLAVSLLVAGAAVCFGQNESVIKGRIIDRKTEVKHNGVDCTYCGWPL